MQGYNQNYFYDGKQLIESIGPEVFIYDRLNLVVHKIGDVYYLYQNNKLITTFTKNDKLPYYDEIYGYEIRNENGKFIFRDFNFNVVGEFD